MNHRFKTTTRPTKGGTIRRTFSVAKTRPVIVYPNGWIEVPRKVRDDWFIGTRQFFSVLDIEEYAKDRGGQMHRVPPSMTFTEIRGLYTEPTAKES